MQDRSRPEESKPMKRVTRKRRSLRTGIGLTAFALVVAVLWREWPRELLLTEVARPVVNVEPHESWYWLSDDQLLVMSVDREGRWPLLNTWQGHADLFDRKTHLRTLLPGLTTLLHRSDVSPQGAPSSFELSPGHTWLIWTNYRTPDNYPFPAAAHLDGTHYREWGMDKSEESFFLDDRHFVQETGDADFSILVRDLQDARNDKRYPRTAPQAKALLASQTARQPYYLFADRSGDETKASLELDAYRTEDTLPALFAYRYPQRKPPVPHHTTLVRLPVGAVLLNSEVSPQQGRVLYHLYIVRENSLAALLKRVSPKFVVKPAVTEEIWFSRANETQMHKIGEILRPSDGYTASDAEDPNQLRNVEWLPDGKQISFIYHGMLYIVSAEPGQ